MDGLAQARDRILVPGEILRKVIGAAMRTDADFAEVFVEDTSTEALITDDGRIEDVNSGRDRGAGVRVMKGGSSSYCFVDSLEEPALLNAARTAAAAANGARGDFVVDLRRREGPEVSPVAKLHSTLDKPAKVELMLSADKAARAYDALIRQVRVTMDETVRNTTVANSEGVLVADSQTRTIFTVTSVASKTGVTQTGYVRRGRTAGLELLDTWPPEECGKESAMQAIVNLHAAPAPSGPMTVVMTNGWGGVLFHEACGHSLEADGIVRGSSVFTGRVGQKVGSDVVTAVDDPTIPNQWGSYAFDDEGNPGQRKVLIENGVLRDYMWDRKSAKKAGHAMTGNGRRQSYHYIAIPRMTNTCIWNGDSKADDILSATDEGLYAKGLRGGQVDSATGDFVFVVSEAYLIRNGKLGDAVRGATLTGNGLQVLNEIDAVADNLDFGPGHCGKGGQNAPAACGQPTLRVRGITVGGTSRRERGNR